MTRSYLAATAGAGLLILSGSVNAAQLTIADIDPANPFGTINVDVAGGDVKGMAKSLEEAQNAELKERCELLIANPIQFKDEDLELCIVVLGKDNEGMTLEGLKSAAAADNVTTSSVGTQTAPATQDAAAQEQPVPPSPELGAEGVPEGNQ